MVKKLVGVCYNILKAWKHKGIKECLNINQDCYIFRKEKISFSSFLLQVYFWRFTSLYLPFQLLSEACFDSSDHAFSQLYYSE